MLRVGLDESNEEKVSRFVSGLRREIQDLVKFYKYSTLENVLHLVLKIETQLKRKDKARRSHSHNDYYSHSWKGKDKEKHDKSPSKSHQEPPLRNKSLGGHTPHHSTSQRSSVIKCFKCLGYGYIALNYPTKRILTLKPSGEVENEHSLPPSPSREDSSSSSDNEIKPCKGDFW